MQCDIGYAYIRVPFILESPLLFSLYIPELIFWGIDFCLTSYFIVHIQPDHNHNMSAVRNPEARNQVNQVNQATFSNRSSPHWHQYELHPKSWIQNQENQAKQLNQAKQVNQATFCLTYCPTLWAPLKHWQMYNLNSTGLSRSSVASNFWIYSEISEIYCWVLLLPSATVCYSLGFVVPSFVFVPTLVLWAHPFHWRVVVHCTWCSFGVFRLHRLVPPHLLDRQLCKSREHRSHAIYPSPTDLSSATWWATILPPDHSFPPSFPNAFLLSDHCQSDFPPKLSEITPPVPISTTYTNFQSDSTHFQFHQSTANPRFNSLCPSLSFHPTLTPPTLQILRCIRWPDSRIRGLHPLVIQWLGFRF